jgi:hypothetical protein
MATLSTKEALELVLAGLKESLFAKLDLGGLHSRNPIAHKWKAPFRSMELREAVHWRLHDLLSQSFMLHQNNHLLGARILLRSAFETLAMLIHLNQLMAQVLDGTADFHIFGEKTKQLLLGSKDGSTPVSSINIVTVLKHCEKRYPGIEAVFAQLSESAHPNYEGMIGGYTRIDHSADTVSFSNRWFEIYGDSHLEMMMACIEIFLREYDEVWPKLFDALEKWIEANDEELEATRFELPNAI